MYTSNSLPDSLETDTGLEFESHQDNPQITFLPTRKAMQYEERIVVVSPPGKTQAIKTVTFLPAAHN